MKLKFIKNILKKWYRTVPYYNTNLELDALNISCFIQDWLGATDYEKVSLGENCNTSWYLKETQNKTASYPFDWVFSSPDIVLHAVKDSFKIFLDKEVIIPKSTNQAGHEIYHSYLFNHRNPLNSEADFSYYKRSIERFKMLLESDCPILFVCTVIQEYDKRPRWKQGFKKSFSLPKTQTLSQFTELISFIKKKHSDVKFVFVNQYSSRKPHIELDSFNSDYIWINYFAKGKNDGVKYLHPFDDMLIKIIYKGFSNEKA
ncbi:DUF1796 family putative cysteine peptidase [Winogradskyella undariae]|uniref:DUF1796 family putative cysteine peptidase n=1 Tax=Winogradskyella undariae TaxID=1285465 RepID=UPI0015CB008E|nr:DUF1796 family putative cysteine peptidase [Winogradskyella undariae]